MMQIVDALDEDGLLRYWGFSYGTVLGSTVAAMFPDRMDKVVLDGCLNPHDYYAGIDLEQVTSTDACFDGFFAACAAHPEQCDLAQGTRTADQLKSQSYDLLYTLKYQPFVAGTDALTEIVDYNFLKTLVENAMYDPGTWPTLATGLRGLLTKNITGIPAIAPFLVPSTPIYQNNGPDAPLGIRSSDVSLRTDNVTTLYPLFEQFYAKSRLFGDVLSLPAMMYAQWPFKAKGGYTGDFRAKTRNPILFVGSDVDPFTPLVSAQNASAGFERSVVLQHGGYGVSNLLPNSIPFHSLTHTDWLACCGVTVS